ncbi:MAG: TatD DNase family protein [Verrucomicrobiota bacterium]
MPNVIPPLCKLQLRAALPAERLRDYSDVVMRIVIDTHCHIDQFPDPLAIARAAEKRAITTVAVTNLPSHYTLSLPHLSAFRHVHSALGLHPLAAASHVRELPEFLRLAASARFVGEVGLDFSAAGRPTRDIQLASFRRVAECLSGDAHFVTVHSRGAETQVLEILRESALGPVVFHRFTGSEDAMNRLLSAGHYVSVNTAMTASRKWHEIFPGIPKERVLTKSDGPHAKCGPRRAEPADIPRVVAWLAERWGSIQRKPNQPCYRTTSASPTECTLSVARSKSAVRLSRRTGLGARKRFLPPWPLHTKSSSAVTPSERLTVNHRCYFVGVLIQIRRSGEVLIRQEAVAPALASPRRRAVAGRS